MAETSTEATDSEGFGRASTLEVLSKCDAIIDFLASHGESSAQRLADAIDEPLSTVYRLLSHLTDVEWVSKAPRRGRFRLGPFFLVVARQFEDRLDIRTLAKPSLDWLAKETGATAYLCIRNDLRAVCIELREGTGYQSLALQLGGSLSLAEGAAPYVLLAFEPDEVVADLLSRIGETAERTVPSDALARVREIRDAGYAVSDQDVTAGIGAVGAPVFDHTGVLVASVSVSGPRTLILGDAEATSRTVKAAAAAVSAALGHRENDGSSR